MSEDIHIVPVSDNVLKTIGTRLEEEAKANEWIQKWMVIGISIAGVILICVIFGVAISVYDNTILRDRIYKQDQTILTLNKSLQDQNKVAEDRRVFLAVKDAIIDASANPDTNLNQQDIEKLERISSEYMVNYQNQGNVKLSDTIKVEVCRIFATEGYSCVGKGK